MAKLKDMAMNNEDLLSGEKMVNERKNHLMNESIPRLQNLGSVTKNEEKFNAMEMENNYTSKNVNKVKKRRKRSLANSKQKGKDKQKDKNKEMTLTLENYGSNKDMDRLRDSNIYRPMLFRNYEDLKQQSRSNLYGYDQQEI